MHHHLQLPSQTHKTQTRFPQQILATCQKVPTRIARFPWRKSLFTPLDITMQENPPYITITPLLHKTFVDWSISVHYMAKHSTSIFQLTTRLPRFITYIDACGLGAGGIWCSGTDLIQPFL